MDLSLRRQWSMPPRVNRETAWWAVVRSSQAGRSGLGGGCCTGQMGWASWPDGRSGGGGHLHRA
eukprot:11538515-Alexandrium_andersonii.AAC.1